MANVIIFPAVNPILPKLAIQFFADTIPAHEEQVNFCQKAQRTDEFKIFFWIPATGGYVPTSGLYTCGGMKYMDLTCQLVTQTVSTTYDLYYVNVGFASAFDDGFDLLTARVTVTKGTWHEDWETEPIYVKEVWPSTMLLTYYNDINDFDLPFEDLTDLLTVLSTRIEGGFPSAGYKPESRDNIFIDQNHVPTMLDSIPYEVRQLQFGAGCGIPNWQINAINRALSCTHFYVDGVRYCKNEGAKLEPTHSSGFPMSGWVVDVIGVAEDYDTAYNLSVIYALGSGDLAFASGPGIDLIVAPPIG